MHKIVIDTNVIISALKSSKGASQKLAALEAETYLLAKAKRGNRKKFLKVLHSVPDVEPDQDDHNRSRPRGKSIFSRS